MLATRSSSDRSRRCTGSARGRGGRARERHAVRARVLRDDDRPGAGARVADKIDAGMVFVNVVGADAAELPFGGVKRSGSAVSSDASGRTSSSTRNSCGSAEPGRGARRQWSGTEVVATASQASISGGRASNFPGGRSLECPHRDSRGSLRSPSPRQSLAVADLARGVAAPRCDPMSSSSSCSGPGMTRPSASSTIATARGCSRTPGRCCRARARTPRTRFRTCLSAPTRGCGPTIGISRCGPGSTGSPTTAASTSCAARPPPAPELIELVRAPVQDPIAEAERRESLRRLVDDVRRLPEQQRSALLMRELAGMSYAELAAALGVSVPAVKSLLVRARVSLAAAAEARDTACSEIRDELILAHDRRVRPNAMARRHLRDCAGCREFRSEMRGVSRQFAALVPGLGPVALLAKSLGIGGGAGGGAAAGSGAAVAGTGGAFAASGLLGTGISHVATLLAAAVVTTGGAIELQSTLGGPGTHAAHHHTRAATANGGTNLGAAAKGSLLAAPSHGTSSQADASASAQPSATVVPAAAPPAPAATAASAAPRPAADHVKRSAIHNANQLGDRQRSGVQRGRGRERARHASADGPAARPGARRPRRRRPRRRPAGSSTTTGLVDDRPRRARRRRDVGRRPASRAAAPGSSPSTSTGTGGAPPTIGDRRPTAPAADPDVTGPLLVARRDREDRALPRAARPRGGTAAPRPPVRAC